jgi:hypothetical protein
MSYKLLSAIVLVVLLSGCSGRFVGFMECARDGSPVWWEYPNSKGGFDGIAVSPENCPNVKKA